MLLGIDHVVIACLDPDEAAAELEAAAGLTVEGGGRHEELGTWNRLAWLGDTYLELIGVFDRERARSTWIGRPTIDALDAGGGIVTFALATDAIVNDVDDLRARRSRLAEPTSGERMRPDGQTVRWQLALPPSLGPDRPPFLIEHEMVDPEWGPDARRRRSTQVHPIGGTARLQRLELAVPDVAATALRYERDLGLGFEPHDESIREAVAGTSGQSVRLLPLGHARPGTAILIRVSSGRPRQVDLLGCRFTIGLEQA